MVIHEHILMQFIMRKLEKLVMYVLRLQQMGSILMEWWTLRTHVGPFLLSL